jgi:hypothetical protein
VWTLFFGPCRSSFVVLGWALISIQRPSQVRAYLENNDMQVYDAPGDEDEFNPRQSFNFAPGYNGIVYRADTPDRGAGPRSHKHGEDVAPAATEEATQAQEDEETDASDHETRYKLQSMKWGKLVLAFTLKDVSNVTRSRAILDQTQSRLWFSDENDQLPR